VSIVSSIVGEVLKLHGVAAYAVIRRRCWRDGSRARRDRHPARPAGRLNTSQSR